MKNFIHFIHSIAILLLSIVSFLYPNEILAATIQGRITNTQNEPLAFANVYIKNTLVGTTSNENGDYQLTVQEGTHDIVFQYVGYQTRTERVTVAEGEAETLHIILQETKIELSEVVVSAAEDPAYRVIREAIKKRPYYKNLIQSYACKTYVKGLQKLADAPTSIFGVEVGDLDGILDTNRQGIVYLSESVSRLYYQRPDRYKEVMISSKVSGNDNGFSFNRASAMDFDFYENSLFLNRALVSPIADNAMNYYRYQLEGYYMEGDYKINKIKVIPKRSHDPAFGGYIYIVEDLWNIHSTELHVTNQSTQLDILDTLLFRQVYLPMRAPDTWMLFSHTIAFKISILGFAVDGVFVGVFNDYKIDTTFADGFFTNEIMVVEEGSNQKSEAYWDSIRPVPLTKEEDIDYVRKDSIRTVRTSKVYLDSVDAVSNRFKLINLIFGYTYNRSYERQQFTVGSPWSTFQYNPVQGATLNVRTSFRQDYDDIRSKWWQVDGGVQYGFSDRRVRGSFGGTYQFNRIHYNKLSASAGQEVRQFNERMPIATGPSTWNNLLYNRNFIRVYDKRFANVQYEQELINGVRMYAEAEYSRRLPLSNTTDFYIMNLIDNFGFSRNIPDNPDYTFDAHEAFVGSLRLRLRFKQTYMSYPNEKILFRSPYPDVYLSYYKGISSDGSTNFDKATINVRDAFSTGVWGIGKFSVEAGAFLNNEAVQFVDFFHFDGNRIFLGRSKNYYRSFFVMPYYENSTRNSYAMLHYEHDFNGILLSRVDGFKKLGWTLVTGFNALYTPDHEEYFENYIGLNNLGFSVFRFFRLDLAMSYNRNGVRSLAFVFGAQF